MTVKIAKALAVCCSVMLGEFHLRSSGFNLLKHDGQKDSPPASDN